MAESTQSNPGLTDGGPASRSQDGPEYDRGVPTTVAGPSRVLDTPSPTSGLGLRFATGRDALSRFGNYLRHGRLERLEAHVAPLTGLEAERSDTDAIVRALNHRYGFRLRPLQRGLARYPGPLDPEALVAAAASARRWLQQSGGDLFVWGEVPSPGTTIHLRFVSVEPPLEEQVGGTGLLSELGLPVGFPPAYAELIHAVALAAAVPRTPGQARGRFYRLATGFRTARHAVASLPPTLTPLERGSLNAGFGDIAALLAQHPPYRPLAVTAMEAYRTALRSLDRTESAGLVAAINRNLGNVALLRPEADYDERLLAEAVEALRAAADGLDRTAMPRLWAATRDRLGEALYRLEARTGETGLLDDAVAAHRAALGVYDRATAPAAWRRIKHNLGRSAQVLGEQRRDRALVETAVASCRDALTASPADEVPMLRAAIYNTLGSALFLLGRQGGGDPSLIEAIDAFGQAADLYEKKEAKAAHKLALKNKTRVEAARRSGSPNSARGAR